MASAAFLPCLQMLLKLGSSLVPLGRQVPGRAQLLNSQPGLPCRGKPLALVALPWLCSTLMLTHDYTGTCDHIHIMHGHTRSQSQSHNIQSHIYLITHTHTQPARFTCLNAHNTRPRTPTTHTHNHPQAHVPSCAPEHMSVYIYHTGKPTLARAHLCMQMLTHTAQAHILTPRPSLSR